MCNQLKTCKKQPMPVNTSFISINMDTIFCPKIFKWTIHVEISTLTDNLGQVL